MIKRPYNLIILFTCFQFKVFAQTDTIIRNERYDFQISQKYNCRLYIDLKEALSDSTQVRCLDLRSKGYQKFPIEIMNLRNLEYLDLSTFDKSALISEKRKAKLKREAYKKEHPNSIVDETELFLGDYNPNKIKCIPDSIKLLVNLKWINVCDTGLSKKQVVRLKELLPNCNIVSNFDE